MRVPKPARGTERRDWEWMPAGLCRGAGNRVK